jgi:hypothetical protein
MPLYNQRNTNYHRFNWAEVLVKTPSPRMDITHPHLSASLASVLDHYPYPAYPTSYLTHPHRPTPKAQYTPSHVISIYFLIPAYNVNYFNIGPLISATV